MFDTDPERMEHLNQIVLNELQRSPTMDQGKGIS